MDSLNSPSDVMKSSFEKLYTLFFKGEYSWTFFVCSCPFASKVDRRNRNEIKKGGIVNDPVVHQRICNGIASWFKEDCDLTTLGIVESPIKGPKGNIEFLIAAYSWFKESANSGLQQL